MQCQSCGEENAATRRFCRACGARLTPVCPACGASNEPGDRFCGECGQALTAAPAPPHAPPPGDDLGGVEERRPVTILFADIVGFTSLSEQLDAEDVRDLTTECLRHLVAEVQSRGGTVDKFIGDAVMVLFGAPIAHEDDPLRAVRAAQAMLQALDRFNAKLERERGLRLGLRIGIETGEVVSGPRDVSGVREYTVIGDAVNLAARLQSATEPGTILIGLGTQRQVRREVALQEMPALELKGKAEPVASWRVSPVAPLAAPHESVPRSPFVGRERERESFHRCLEELRRGRGQVLILTGNPGLGKSRLLAELRSTAGDVRWYRTAAFATESSTSYGLARRLLASLCGVADGTSDALGEEVAEHLGRLECAEQTPVLARLLGIPGPLADAELPAGMGPSEAVAAAAFVFECVFRDLSRDQPAVIEIDDLHWADPSSIELLTALLDVTERMPLLFCASFRPERDAPVWQLRETVARVFHHRYMEIELHPLTHAEASSLAAQLFGARDVPEALHAVLDRAAGTPLWLEELVLTLRERGLIRFEGGAWVTDGALDRAEIPDTLHGLIVARLDRLGDARPTLQTASVIGRVFNQRVLAQIVGHEAIDSHLIRAQRADIVRELAVLPEREYGFKHVLVQEATYGTLLVRRRRALHRQVARTLRSLYAANLEPLQPTLAFHAMQAEDWDLALEHSLAAARIARSSFANRETITHLTNALTALDRQSGSPEIRLSTLRSRAEVETLTGDFEAARADYEQARAITRALGDQVAEAQVVGALAMLWAGHRDYEQGLALAEEAVSVAQESGAPGELAQAQVRLATALVNLNREDRCRESLRSALEYFQAARDDEGEASTLDILGMVSYVFGSPRDAVRYSEQAMARLREIGDRWREASSAIVRGISAAALGDLPSARHWIGFALDTWTEMDAVSGVAFARNCRAQIEQPFGGFQTALEHARAGLETAEGIKHIEWMAMGHWQLGRVYRSCGLMAESEEHLREMLRLADSMGSTLWSSLARGELATTLIQHGMLKEAEELITIARPSGSGQDMATHQVSLAACELALTRGAYQEALDLAQTLRRRPGGFPHLELDAAVVAGRALSALGRSEESVALLIEASETARGWGALPPYWRLQLALASVCLEMGDTQAARQAAKSAREALERVAGALQDPSIQSAFRASQTFREAENL